MEVETKWTCDMCSAKNDADADHCASCTLLRVHQANTQESRTEVQSPLQCQHVILPSGFIFAPTIEAIAQLCGTTIPVFLDSIAG